jgi:hypothetical protein
VEVPSDEGRGPRQVLLQERVALSSELADGGVEVGGRPQRDAVEHEAKGAKLVLQAALIVAVQLVLAAVADLAGQVVVLCVLRALTRVPLISAAYRLG